MPLVTIVSPSRPMSVGSDSSKLPSARNRRSWMISGNIVDTIGFGDVQRPRVGVVDQEQSGETALHRAVRWIRAGVGDTRASTPTGRSSTPVPSVRRLRWSGAGRRRIGRADACRANGRSWALASVLSIVNATDSPRSARTVGPRMDPLKPQVSVSFPATISVVPAPARSVKWRTPASSTVDSASGGIGSGREVPATANVALFAAGSAPQPTASPRGAAARPNRIVRLEIRFIVLLEVVRDQLLPVNGPRCRAESCRRACRNSSLGPLAAGGMFWYSGVTAGGPERLRAAVRWWRPRCRRADLRRRPDR